MTTESIDEEYEALKITAGIKFNGWGVDAKLDFLKDNKIKLKKNQKAFWLYGSVEYKCTKYVPKSEDN